MAWWGGTIRLIQVEDQSQSFPTIGVTGPPRHEAFPNRDARRNTAPTFWREAGVSGDFATGFIKGNMPRAHSKRRLKSTGSQPRLVKANLDKDFPAQEQTGGCGVPALHARLLCGPARVRPVAADCGARKGGLFAQIPQECVIITLAAAEISAEAV